MKRFAINISIALALALGALATLALLSLLGRLPEPPVARAGPGARYVAPGGLDAGNDCSDGSSPCATIQHAVDAAVHGDVVQIATGVYSDVHGRPVPPGYPHPPAGGIITQVVYLSKSLSLRGGYAVPFTDPPDPDANPTTLDARGVGRVLFIAGPAAGFALASGAEVLTGQAISLTLEGLHITAGSAADLGGSHGWDDAGGGAYVISATVTLSDCHISSNHASYGGGLYLYGSNVALNDNTISENTTVYYGGGLYLRNTHATLDGNTISHNGGESGGGLHLNASTATLSANIISDNDAIYSGGGLRLYYSAATLTNNTISHNCADDGSGGGLYLNHSDATLKDNVIFSNHGWSGGGGLSLRQSGNVTLDGNIVSSNGGYYGGGLRLSDSPATLISNIISANYADTGGGLYLDRSAATLSGNTISANTANYDGGGLYLGESPATLIANTIVSNIVRNGGSVGGLYLSGSDATLINNVVVDNRAGNTGCGIHIAGSSPRLLHTTIARNDGDNGRGICVTDDAGTYSAVALTNTLLASQAVGIDVTAGNTATLAGTLWGGGAWANGSDWDGAGTILTGTVNLWGDPDFLDPDNGDYHIGLGSAAIDAGVDAEVTADIDGEPRPWGAGYDIGADEYYRNQAPYTPSDPTPAHGATGVPLTQTLSWRGGDPNGDPVTYTIAFGANDPPPLSATTPLTSYTPALVAGTTYHWSVSASDGVSLSVGPLWRFTTQYSFYLPILLHRFP